MAQENFTQLVKIRLLRQRKSITQFASELGHARNYVSRAINHPASHRTLAGAISRALRIKL